jgi:transposase-like protein
MAFSDVEKEKDAKRNVNRAIDAGTNKRWSDKQKLEAVNSFLLLGNVSLVSRILGIPRITLQVWKASNWWKELVDEIKLQDRIELSNKMKKIVSAAHAVVEDRLINGDMVVTPKGEMIRKPVAMKDAHRVAVDLLNQKDVIEKAMSKEPGAEGEGSSDKLEVLAERFAMFATKKIEQSLDKKRTVDVVDVVDVSPKEQHEVAQDDSVSDTVLSGNPTGTTGVGEETKAGDSQPSW